MKKISIHLFVLAIFVTVMSTAAHAQAIYAQYTGERVNLSGSNTWFSGGTFGFYMDRGGLLPVHLGLDARGSFLRADNDGSINRFMVGPRLSFVPHVVPLKVYGEALVGLQKYHQKTASASVTVDKTDFGYQFVGGVEYTFFPRLDWRMVEVGANHLSNGAQSSNNLSLSSGLVVRF